MYSFFFLNLCGVRASQEQSLADIKGLLSPLQLFLSVTVSESVAGALFVPHPLKSCHLWTGIIDAQRMMTIGCPFHNLHLESARVQISLHP